MDPELKYMLTNTGRMHLLNFFNDLKVDLQKLNINNLNPEAKTSKTNKLIRIRDGLLVTKNLIETGLLSPEINSDNQNTLQMYLAEINNLVDLYNDKLRDLGYNGGKRMKKQRRMTFRKGKRKGKRTFRKRKHH